MVSLVSIVFLLNILNALVALLTSYYSYKFNRLLKNPVITSISAGFMLLGIGLAFEAITSVFTGRTVIQIFAIRTIVGYSTIAYLLFQLVAYLLIAIGYGLSAYTIPEKVAALFILQIPVRPRLEPEFFAFTLLVYFFTVVLLAFILFQGLLIHTRQKDRFSLLVLFAFGLIFVAHVLLLFSLIQLSISFLILGDIVQFLGFVSLLAFIIRSGSVGAS